MVVVLEGAELGEVGSGPGSLAACLDREAGAVGGPGRGTAVGGGSTLRTTRGRPRCANTGETARSVHTEKSAITRTERYGNGCRQYDVLLLAFCQDETEGYGVGGEAWDGIDFQTEMPTVSDL